MTGIVCVDKFRDKNGNIIRYKLADIYGNSDEYSSETVKNYIRYGTINVLNLTLTSDGRLVDKKISTEDEKENNKIKEFVTRAISKGYSINPIRTADNSGATLASKDNEHIIFIAESTKYLNGDRLNFTDCISYIHGSIKVIGGRNVKSTVGMFKDCEADIIDITKFDTSKVTATKDMFLHYTGKLICNDSKILKQYEIDKRLSKMTEEEYNEMIADEKARIIAGHKQRDISEMLNDYEQKKKQNKVEKHKEHREETLSAMDKFFGF